MSVHSVVATSWRTGALDPTRLATLGVATLAWGPTTASAYGAAALRFPLRTAIVDDAGSINYAQLDGRTTRVAGAMAHLGLGRGAPVGILCRNHRGFVEANLALAKLGARIVYLNPTLPANQIDEVARREKLEAVVVDTDLAEGLSSVDAAVRRIWVAPIGDPKWSFPDLPRWRPLLRWPRPRATDDPVVLTSGTTGAPRGTSRTPGAGAAVVAFGVLEVVPFRQGDVMVVAAPLFHAWGLSQLLLGATLGATVVLRSRFDPATTMADVEVHAADVLCVVPVMLHRILELEIDVDASSLRIVASSGSALPGGLASAWIDRFGPSLYNLYGSTEVGQVSVATPAQLASDPTSAGRPLRGVDVRIVDDVGAEVGDGEIGRIMVRSAMHFDGYTDGTTKERQGDFMSIGDLGRRTADGQLLVVGRADDMIISGGENVHPSNVERALAEVAGLSEWAVVGVPDADLGQRVRAVIVPEAGVEVEIPELRRRLRATLAAHEVPREFVVVDELPRNGAGKVLRRSLAEIESPPKPRKRKSTR